MKHLFWPGIQRSSLSCDIPSPGFLSLALLAVRLRTAFFRSITHSRINPLRSRLTVLPARRG